MGRRWIWGTTIMCLHYDSCMASPPAPTARRTPPHRRSYDERQETGYRGRGLHSQPFRPQRTLPPCLFRDAKPGRAHRAAIARSGLLST